DLGSDCAIAQHLEAIGAVVEDAGLDERGGIHNGTVLETVEHRDIHSGEGLGEDVVEAALGDPARQRHLAAFETGAHLAAAASLLTLMTAAGGLAVAGTGATALPFSHMGRAHDRSKFVQVHDTCTSLCFLSDLEQVADLGDLAAGLGVVRLYNFLTDLAQAKRIGSGNVLVKAAVEALDKFDLQISHDRASLTDDFFHALAPDASNLFRATQGHETLHAGLDHVLGVVGAKALGTDVGNAHSLHHRTHRAAGDDAGAFGGGLEEHRTGAEDAGHFVGNGGAVQGDLHHVLLGIGNALEDRFGNFRSLAQAIANGTLAIADDNQRAELHHAAALDGLGNTVEVHNLFDKLRRLVGGLSISIVSHSSSSSD